MTTGIGNTKEFTATDGSGLSGDHFNVDTSQGIVSIPNGKTLAFYSDAYTTLTGQIKNGNYVQPVSSSAAALATSGTITTANVGVARVNPGSAVNAVVLGSGTLSGQQVTVINEAAATNTVQFAASGSSFVADGINNIIPGLQMRTFVWDGAQSLWYAEPLTTNGSIDLLQSSTSPAIASSGTVTTQGVGVARVTPGAAATSCVMQAGQFPGQMIVVINESTTGANSVAFAASASSNVADGNTTAISGLRAAIYWWDSVQSLWFKVY